MQMIAMGEEEIGATSIVIWCNRSCQYWRTYIGVRSSISKKKSQVLNYFRFRNFREHSYSRLLA